MDSDDFYTLGDPDVVDLDILARGGFSEVRKVISRGVEVIDVVDSQPEDISCTCQLW